MSQVNISTRLEPWMIKELDKEAKEYCTSRGAVLRMVIKKHIEDKHKSAGFSLRRVKDLVGAIETGTPDLAKNHKKYLDEAFKADK